MEHFQPKFVPPIVRVPQLPPQQIAINRRVYIPPIYKRSSRAPYAPLSLPSSRTASRFMYPLPVRKQSSSPHQPAHPFPAGSISPAFTLPITPRRPPAVPDTPNLFLPYAARTAYMSTRRDIQPGTPLRTPHPGIPVTPPISIPGRASHKAAHEEPGVAETLMGCATLMLIGIVFLAILYYLAT